MRIFEHFVVIDWSGQATARPKGLAVASAARGSDAPTLLRPEKGWSRLAILDWLSQHAEARTNMLIGLDLSPGLPFLDRRAYFPGWDDSPKDALALWELVDRLSADDPHLAVNSFLAHPEVYRHFRHQNGCGDKFQAGAGRLRVCEEIQKNHRLIPSSCFNLIGAAQVGKSSLTGMRVLNRLRGKVPVWPFDELPEDGPAIVEIYTSLAAREAGIRKGRSKLRTYDALNETLATLESHSVGGTGTIDDHSSDALLTAAWLRKVADEPARWNPPALTPQIARTEGWTFGAV